MNDPIVDEVRRVREKHAAQFNFDLWAIYRDIKQQQESSGLKFVSFAGEPTVAKPEVVVKPNQGRQPTGPASAVSDIIPPKPADCDC